LGAVGCHRLPRLGRARTLRRQDREIKSPLADNATGIYIN
jgi:hypothetical protein